MTARPGPGCGPLLAALLAVLQGQARALQTTRSKPLVRMGYFQESQPFAVACARGWLNTVEYDVGCFPQSSGDYAVSKLDSGDLDLAQLGSTPIAVSNARGVDVVSFQMAHDSSHSQGMCTKGGGGPMSLLGKRIACPFGSTAHFHMLFLLSELGLPVCPGAQRAPHPGCVALENMSPSALIAAWDADKIDGGFVWGHAFVHMRTHGGIVIMDSETLKQWGRNTFIVVAARRAFLQAHVHWVQRISRIKMLLDESWLLSESVWQASGQTTSYIASVGHLAGVNVSSVQEQLMVHRYISERDFSSTSKQKGLATPVPNGKWMTATVEQAAAKSSSSTNPWFASLIDSSIMYNNSGFLDLSTVMADLAAQVALTSPAATAVAPSGHSIEAGTCTDYNLAPGRVRQLSAGRYTIGAPFMLPVNDSELTGVVTDKGSLAASLTGGSYRDGLHCLWGIKSKPSGVPGTAQYLLLNFTTLRVWAGDLVRVYQTPTLHNETGAYSGAGPLIAQLSGIDHAWPTLRSSHDVLVEFKTDLNAETCYNFPEGDGWTLVYDRADRGCTSNADCNQGQCNSGLCACISGWGGADCSYPSCLGTVSVQSTSGTFKSSVHALESMHLYPNNAECVFVSRGSIGDVVQFTIDIDLEETFDYLEVRAGQSSAHSVEEPYAKLSGQLQRTMVVLTDAAGDASLRFTTDNKGRRSGFIATFQRQQPSPTSCAHLNNCGTSPHSKCVEGQCECGDGWAGLDCSSPICTPQPVLISNTSEAGVIRSGTAGLMPPLAHCEWQIDAGQRNEISGVRFYLTSPGCSVPGCVRDNCDCSALNRTVRAGLHPHHAGRVGWIDIESSIRGSGGDFVTIQSAGQAPLPLALHRCKRNQDCYESWQSGVCENHYDGTTVCGFKHSIDITQNRSSAHPRLMWLVSLSSDRNDGANSPNTGLSLGWELISTCPQREQRLNSARKDYQCLLGSCDCELAGGTCSDTGACTLANKASDCGCGGVLVSGDRDVYLAGIFDLTSTMHYAYYMRHHFTLAVDLINNKTDGFWDDVLTDSRIRINMADSQCSERKGAPAYWSMREWGQPLHGVIGCRCSGASMAVASVASLEQLPQISFSATSPRLSNKKDFPYFFRTVTPDGLKGGVGAVVQLMRVFGWERVMILHTSKPWSYDTATQFSRAWIGEHNATGHSPAWTGEVVYSGSIEFGSDGAVDSASVAQAFKAVPVNQHSTNSRVMFLPVHSQDAWPILKHAAEIGFQKDTIFVGPGSWIGGSVPADFTSVPEIPGYLGLVPFENPAPENAAYLRHLHQYEAAHNMSMSTSVTRYGAEVVDAVVAMAKALGTLPHSQRRNGTLVHTAIRNTSFAGVSGLVEFDANGDLTNPQFTVVNLGPRSPTTGKFNWTNVGLVGPQPSQSNVQTSKICWPVIGCGGAPPSDRHPAPPPVSSIVKHAYQPVGIIVGGIAIVVALLFYWAQRWAQRLRHRRNKFKKDTIMLRDSDGSTKRRFQLIMKEKADKKHLRLLKESMENVGTRTVSVHAQDVTDDTLARCGLRLPILKQQDQQDKEQATIFFMLNEDFQAFELLDTKYSDEKLPLGLAKVRTKGQLERVEWQHAVDALEGTAKTDLHKCLNLLERQQPQSSSSPRGSSGDSAKPKATHICCCATSNEIDEENPRAPRPHLRVVAMQRRHSRLDEMLSRIAGDDVTQVKQYLKQIAKVFMDLQEEKLVHRGTRLMHFDVDTNTDKITLHYLHKVTSIEKKPELDRYRTSIMPPELARAWLDKAQPPNNQAIQHAIWGFGTFVYRMCTGSDRYLFASSADGQCHYRRDMETIAYGWEQRKLARTDEINWPHAADLALWCLQTEPERRPQSFEQILGHRFFDESGQLHLLDSDAAWHPPWHPPLLPTLKLAAARCTKEMHAAIRAGELEKLKAVFARGAVHVLAEMQNLSSIVLPFHHAAMRGNSEVMEFLMAEVPALHVDHESFGTNGDLLRFVKDVLDRQDQFGYTALHWCAAYNHADIARKLLKQGCDPSICNHSGKTAWDVAESANSTEVLALFDETSTITAEKEQSGPAPDQGVDESDKTVGCIEESLLRREWERRKRRPDVPPTSDDIELDHARLTYWNVEPYENWRQIGEGGNGRVFLVTEVAPTIQIVYNSKEVRQFHKAVVKFAKPDGVEMLKAEVESLSVLKHKNVVEILGMAEGGAPEMEGSRWMMLLEFCESDLNRLLHVNDDPKNYSWKLMDRLCREIVDGMAYLHGKEHEATKQTYMHLDLKPDNILLANEGTKEQPVWTAKIADFGWDPQLKQDEWTGTALYMAPEFAIRILELDKLYRGVALPTDSKGNDIDVGPAADVFSFGVLLWEMFARKTPFDALAALKGGTPPPCSCASPLQSGTACLRKMSKWMVGEDQLRPVIPVNFPAALRLLVEACWAEEPVSRPNFADIQQALQSMHVDWFAPTATPAPPAPPQTVQEWLDKLGLGSKLELLESYLQGTPKTIEDNAFREFVEDEDLDDYVDEMVGEGDDELNADELNVDEAAKLKAALHDLIGEDGADPEAGQESQDWDALVKSFGRPGTQTMLERNDNELKRLREEVVQLRAEVRRGAQGTSGTMVSEQTFRELLEPEPEPESEPDEI